MKVIRASSTTAHIPEGFPILVDQTMCIHEAAFAYLLEIATLKGRTRSPETLRTYCEHLYEWLEALEQSGIDWLDADEDVLLAFRNRMLENASPHTGRPYATSTINSRLRGVCRFYIWAKKRGYLDELPFYIEDVYVLPGRKDHVLQHLDRNPTQAQASTLTLREQERIPRALSVKELRRLLANLDMPYRLMAEWAVATGMRRKELCGLNHFQIPNTHLIDGADDLIGIPLTITKGDVPRTVYPPLRLVDRTNWYIAGERAALIKSRRRQSGSYQPPPNLFLNSRGVAVDKYRFTQALTAGFKAAGLRGTGHWLRHTFAITILAWLQRQAQHDHNINPLKALQTLLGHSHIGTTDVYLRCVELHRSAITQSIESLYAELIPDGQKTD